MQLAGAACAICKKNILVDSDATWCARCSSVMHGKCLETVEKLCPVCRAPYDRPENHFVFSEQCPECFRPNNPPQPQCRSCSARTRWDTNAEFAEFATHMRATARVQLFRGIAELAGGALCLGGLILIFSIGRRPPIFPLGIAVLGFIVLVADGLLSLIRSRRIAGFR